MRVPAHVWVGVAGVVAGCLPATSHQCETSAQCSPTGMCEANGACSFPASDCPSGRRYGDATGPLAGQCVEDGSSVDAADVDTAAGDGGDPDAAAVLPWGDGHHGDLTVSIAQAQVNSYGFVRQDAAVGATLIMATRNSGATVGAWNDNFEPGDRLMVWRTSGMANPATSGSTATLILDADVGRWFVTRVLARAADRVTLADPLPFACPADRCQVIKLPELDLVMLNAGTNLNTPDWQGQWGGLVGFYANQLIIDGATVEASADGLRGAPAENVGSFSNCTALDGPSAAGGGAAKGESLVPSRFGLGASTGSGRGNIHHGGGGGDCQDSGGGGGGHAGGGGGGGNDELMRSVGGMAGVAVRYSPATHLVMGGGAGAGEDNTTTGGSGGYGGGVVWLTVRTITCTNGGEITAVGGDGGDIADDGGGGGGGGGLIWIRAETINGCRFATDGGDGGTTQGSNGPGGGGGGGKIIIVSDTANILSATAGAGIAGTNGVTPYGAIAGQPGAICGNDTLEAGETCDDGNHRPGDGCTYCSE